MIKRILSFDRLYLAIIILICLLGLGVVLVSSYHISLKNRGYPYYYTSNHLLSLVLGVGVFFFVALSPLDRLKKIIIPIFLGSLFFCVLVFVPVIGKKVSGASRWVHFMGISFQPSEFLKIAMVGLLAYMISKKGEHLNSLVRGVIPLLCVVGTSTFVVAIEPDLSSGIIILTTGLFIVFINRIKITYFFLVASLLLPLLVFIFQTKSYFMSRFYFFIANLDPFGRGYHILQALKSYRIGGMFGVDNNNLLNSAIYFPDVHTDFVFAFLARTGGLSIVLLTILLLVLFIFSSFKMAMEQHDVFARNICLGISFIFMIETFIHIFVNIGLAPTTGSVLPFLSYGRTAMITHFIMVGILINFASKNKNDLDGFIAIGEKVKQYQH